MTRDEATVLVLVERSRQLQLKREGRFSYTPSDLELEWFERLAIIMEEVGEVARECLALSGMVQETADPHKLQKELIQLGAVTVACIEATELAWNTTGD